MNSNRISYANVLSETQFVQLRKQIPTLWFDTCSYTPFMFKIEILILKYCLCLHNCYWFHTWSYTTIMFRIEILILKHCLFLLNCYWFHTWSYTTFMFRIEILILKHCWFLLNCYWFHTWSYTTFMFRMEILILKYCLVLLNCYGDSTYSTEERTIGSNGRRKCFQLMILTPKLLSKSETAIEQNNNTDVSRYLYCIWE